MTLESNMSLCIYRLPCNPRGSRAREVGERARVKADEGVD